MEEKDELKLKLRQLDLEIQNLSAKIQKLENNLDSVVYRKTLDNKLKDIQEDISLLRTKIYDDKLTKEEIMKFEKEKEELDKKIKELNVLIHEKIVEQLKNIKKEIIENNELNKRVQKIISGKTKDKKISFDEIIRNSNQYNLIYNIKELEEKAKFSFWIAIALITIGTALFVTFLWIFIDQFFTNTKLITKDIYNLYWLIFLVYLMIMLTFFILIKRESNFLEMKRFYINELHNFVFKEKALEFFQSYYPDPDLDVNYLLKTLLTEERNFILNKNQSTIEIEKMKTENNSLILSLTNLLDKIALLITKRLKNK